jgi:glucose dehydrogenase
LPGVIGGSGWGGGAFDPTTGTIYLKVTNQPAVFRVTPPRTRSDTLNADYAADLGASVSVTPRDPTDSTRRLASVPINKPPYGTMVAIDLNTGEERWRVPFGDNARLRSHPLLAGLSLPPLGVSGAPGAIVTAGGVLFATGGGATLYALDTRDGRTLWSHDLGQTAYAVPMTYRTRTGKQFVLIATGAANGAHLSAFALR